LHLNPVNPTRFLQTLHRFGWDTAATATSGVVGRSSASATSGRVNSGGGGRERKSITGEEEDDDDAEEEAEAEAEEREASTVDLIEASCCSLRQKSL